MRQTTSSGRRCMWQSLTDTCTSWSGSWPKWTPTYPPGTRSGFPPSWKLFGIVTWISQSSSDPAAPLWPSMAAGMVRAIAFPWCLSHHNHISFLPHPLPGIVPGDLCELAFQGNLDDLKLLIENGVRANVVVSNSDSCVLLGDVDGMCVRARGYLILNRRRLPVRTMTAARRCTSRQARGTWRSSGTFCSTARM